MGWLNNSNILKYVLVSSILKYGSANFHRILCIGDSITHGIGSTNFQNSSYPARLEEILSKPTSSAPGDTISVLNFGLMDSTVQKFSRNSYWKSDIYKDALNHANFSTIIIFQFGADVHSILRENIYIDDYKSLIESFRLMNPNLHIFVCIPPPRYRRRRVTNSSSTVMEFDERMINVTTIISIETKSHLIDIYSIMGGKQLTMGEYFTGNGIHPNDIGYQVMATTIAKALHPFLI